MKTELVFNPFEYNDWIHNTALTPTPFLLNSEVIRVYCGFRDTEGVSRIGYVDVSSSDPTKVIKVSSRPSLDIGRDGCFDDNGVILGDVYREGEVLHMYYVGFQLVKKAKFLAFTGLAISKDDGETFHRVSESPVLDRVNDGCTIMAIHSLLKDHDKIKVWFAKGNGWEYIDNKPFPQYNIWEADSSDGINFHNFKLVIDNDSQLTEYRIGRPSSFEAWGRRFMFYTKGTKSGKDYYPGLAIQLKDSRWKRIDHKFPLKLSDHGWDSLHLSYPRIIEVLNKYYIFYNGNNMGFEGFGVAEVTEWVNTELKDIALNIS